MFAECEGVLAVSAALYMCRAGRTDHGMVECTLDPHIPVILVTLSVLHLFDSFTYTRVHTPVGTMVVLGQYLARRGNVTVCTQSSQSNQLISINHPRASKRFLDVHQEIAKPEHKASKTILSTQFPPRSSTWMLKFKSKVPGQVSSASYSHI